MVSADHALQFGNSLQSCGFSFCVLFSKQKLFSLRIYKLIFFVILQETEGTEGKDKQEGEKEEHKEGKQDNSSSEKKEKKEEKPKLTTIRADIKADIVVTDLQDPNEEKLKQSKKL